MNEYMSCLAISMLLMTVFASHLFAAPFVEDVVEFRPYRVLPKDGCEPSGSGYLVSYDEYLKLISPPFIKDEKVKERERRKERNERHSSIKTQSFTKTKCFVEIGEKRALVKLVGTFERRGQGWTSLTLLEGVGTAFLRCATCNGKVISAETSINGDLIWQTKSSGKLSFVLELTSLIEASGRYGYQTSFPVFRSPVNEIFLTTKRKNSKDWQLLSSQKGKSCGLLWQKEAKELKGCYEPSTFLTLKWKVPEVGLKREKEEKGEERRPPQLSYHFSHYIKMSDDHFRGRGKLQVEVEHQPVSELSFVVPKELSLLDINSPMLREWYSTPCKQGRRVTLKLLRERMGKIKFDFQSHGVLVGGKIGKARISLPLAPESYHERQLLALDSESHIELKVLRKSEQVRTLDGSKFPAKELGLDRGALHACYSTSRHPAYEKSGADVALTIDVEAKRHEKAALWTAVVDLVDAVTLVTKDSYVVTRISYYVKNNSEQFLVVDLPNKDIQILTTFVSHKAVIPARGEKGKLLVPLERSTVRNTQANAFPVELTYLHRQSSVVASSSLELSLPQINLVASTVRWTVRSPKGYKLVHQGGTVREDPKYRQVDYLGKDDSRANLLPKTLRIFDTTTLPLRLRLPEGAPTLYYSSDLVSPADSPPALHCKVVPLMISRQNKKSVFMAAALLSIVLLFGIRNKKRSYTAAAILLLASGLSLGALSHLREGLGLGQFFALGVFFGVTVFVLSKLIFLE